MHTWTHVDFEQMGWHDNYIYGIFFQVEDWTANLVLDIDYITEWVCGMDKSPKWMVSPATLTFEDVTDAKIDIDWGDSGMRTSMHPVSIHEIQREQVKDQKICLDRPYYKWTIVINWPEGSSISFGSTGFTQALRSKPILSDEQMLPWSKRKKLKFP